MCGTHWNNSLYYTENLIQSRRGMHCLHTATTASPTLTADVVHMCTLYTHGMWSISSITFVMHRCWWFPNAPTFPKDASCTLPLRRMTIKKKNSTHTHCTHARCILTPHQPKGLQIMHLIEPKYLCFLYDRCVSPHFTHSILIFTWWCAYWLMFRKYVDVIHVVNRIWFTQIEWCRWENAMT